MPLGAATSVGGLKWSEELPAHSAAWLLSESPLQAQARGTGKVTQNSRLASGLKRSQSGCLEPTGRSPVEALMTTSGTVPRRIVVRGHKTNQVHTSMETCLDNR